MNFYPHHLGDYAKDTKDLAMLEHAAYRLLLDHNYATEQPVPNEIDKLYRIAGARTPAELKAVEKVAERFFPINGDGRRHNKRAEAEIARAKEKRAKAKGSAEARWGNAGAPPDADRTDMRTHSERNASQSHKPEKAKTSDAPASEGRGGAATIPDCPHVLLVALYHEMLPTLPQTLEWNAQRQAMARSRWREKAVSEKYATVEEGLAYWRRFFVWVSKSDFLMGRTDPKQGRKPFLADLEWLLTASKFTKVLEGKYHS